MDKMYSYLLLMQVVCWKRKETNTKRELEGGGGKTSSFYEKRNIPQVTQNEGTRRMVDFLSDFETEYQSDPLRR